MSSTFEKAFHLSNFIFPKGGTCLEFGVYVGNTYMYQVQHILNKYTNTKLIGFDSWQGLPPETEGIWYPDRHATGKFATTKDVPLPQNGSNTIPPSIHNNNTNSFITFKGKIAGWSMFFPLSTADSRTSLFNFRPYIRIIV